MRLPRRSLPVVLLLAPLGCGAQLGDEGKITCDQSEYEVLEDLDVTLDEWTMTVAERLAADAPPAEGTLTLGAESAVVTQTLSLDEEVRHHLLGSCTRMVSVTGTVSVAASPLLTFEEPIVVSFYPDRTWWSVAIDREEGLEILPPRTMDPAEAESGLYGEATLSGGVWTGSLGWNGQEDEEEPATWEATVGE